MIIMTNTQVEGTIGQHPYPYTSTFPSAKIHSPSPVEPGVLAPTKIGYNMAWYFCKKCSTPIATPQQILCGDCLVGRKKKPRSDTKVYEASQVIGDGKGFRPKPCATCGAIFNPARSASKYCSNKCKHEGMKVNMATSTCENCGVEFKHARSERDRRFCSKDCDNEFRRTNWHRHRGSNRTA